MRLLLLQRVLLAPPAYEQMSNGSQPLVVAQCVATRRVPVQRGTLACGKWALARTIANHLHCARHHQCDIGRCAPSTAHDDDEALPMNVLVLRAAGRRRRWSNACAVLLLPRPAAKSSALGHASCACRGAASASVSALVFAWAAAAPRVCARALHFVVPSVATVRWPNEMFAGSIRSLVRRRRPFVYAD